MGLPQVIRRAIAKDFRGKVSLGKDLKLRTVGAFEGFVNGPHGDQAGNADGVPDEPAPSGFDWRSAITLGARAARTLWLGGARIENDAIGGTFRNLAHVIFDGDSQRTTRALDDQFLGTQYRNLSDGRLIGVRANYSRRHVQGKRFRIGSRETGSAESQCCGGSRVLLRERSHARAGEEKTGSTCANLDTAGLSGAESIAAKNGCANGSLPSAKAGVISINNCTEPRRRSGPERSTQ